METNYEPIEDLVGCGNALVRATGDSDSAYGWVDLASPRATGGRGFLATGTICGVADGATGATVDAKPPPQGHGPALFGRQTLPVLNFIYRRRQLAKTPDTQPLTKALFPAVANATYFRGFGKRGFIEQQVLVPRDAWTNYAAELIGLVQKHQPGIGLAILKHFRDAPRLLRFNGDGLSLALHILANDAQSEFSRSIDELAIRHGAFGNLSKDSRLTAHVAQRMYSEYDEFHARLRDFDRNRLFQTALSERLAL